MSERLSIRSDLLAQLGAPHGPQRFRERDPGTLRTHSSVLQHEQRDNDSVGSDGVLGAAQLNPSRVDGGWALYRRAGWLPGRVMFPRWSTGSGWASVLNTQLSRGNRSSLEKSRDLPIRWCSSSGGPAGVTWGSVFAPGRQAGWRIPDTETSQRGGRGAGSPRVSPSYREDL
ncbi:hypothetical protein CRUP_009334 [Coryphaenoides rupestris]|nr:hypothetical protein CRUP_009334 [Coryphaenoides rupestris]